MELQQAGLVHPTTPTAWVGLVTELLLVLEVLESVFQNLLLSIEIKK